jgi:ribosomal protein S18 acetylase RimI-like enzyme
VTTTIRRATPADLPTVSALAGRIWRAHYPSIIAPAQIEYMLQWMYSLPQLEQDVQRGVVYELLYDGDHAIGFCGYEEVEGELKLHKLYVEVTEHGRGLGTLLLKHVEDEARRRGLQTLVLGVNKRNAKAIRAYERNGFTVRKEIVTDIGGGFVMDDYLYEKKI